MVDFCKARPPQWYLLSGYITIVPLLLFTGCARRLRLATVGLMQYIAPTGQFLTAVLVFGEAFGTDRIIAFCLIWAAVILYSLDAWRHTRKNMVVTIPE